MWSSYLSFHLSSFCLFIDKFKVVCRALALIITLNISFILFSPLPFICFLVLSLNLSAFTFFYLSIFPLNVIGYIFHSAFVLYESKFCLILQKSLYASIHFMYVITTWIVCHFVWWFSFVIKKWVQHEQTKEMYLVVFHFNGDSENLRYIKSLLSFPNSHKIVSPNETHTSF